MKYAPAHSPIAIDAQVTPSTVTLRIADHGMGISAEDLPHVFDSFYRASRGDRIAPGTGLGLAIAHGLIEAMGGTIEAVSPRPDGEAGTMIVMRLPRS